METVTITATHSPGYSTLVLLAVGILVVGLLGWQVVARTRATRSRG